jgi:hypothetical protein
MNKGGLRAGVRRERSAPTSRRPPPQETATVPRSDLSLWKLLRDLGRSPTGLGLVALVGFTLLAGLGVMTLCRYRLWVQVASIVVDFSPAEVPPPAQKPPAH